MHIWRVFALLLPCAADLVCEQRTAQLFAQRGGSLVTGFAFHSQAHQDWAVAGVLQVAGILHAKSGDESSTPLRYVDLAANEALSGSNTAFFDRCLKWRGLCIEPQPNYHAAIRSKRSCALEPTCVNENGTHVTFNVGGPLGQIQPGRRLTIATMELQCSRLDALLRKQGRDFEHINYLSLDIEGAELSALSSIDWSRTTIDVMTVENAKDDLKTFLAARGIVPVLCVHLDTLFVRRPLVASAQKWYDHHARHALPSCIYNDTALCGEGQGTVHLGKTSYMHCLQFWKSEARWAAARESGGEGREPKLSQPLEPKSNLPHTFHHQGPMGGHARLPPMNEEELRRHNKALEVVRERIAHAAPLSQKKPSAPATFFG